MAKYTKGLFFLSLILSFFTLYSIKNGGREFYPFYSWKLFTSPSGSNAYEKEYRIYGVKDNDTIRLNNSIANNLYDENEKFAIIQSFGSLVVQHKNFEENKKKLFRLGKILDPSCQDYLLVEEYYKPRDLDKKDFSLSQRKVITSLR